MNKSKPAGKIGQIASGQYKVMVVDSATGKVVREQPWQHNLILNQGLDRVAVMLWADCFVYGIAGTGTRPNTVDSSTDTAVQSGTTVTKTGALLDFTGTDADVGDMIKWDSGEEARIIAITSANVCEVANSATVASGEFTIYHTAQVGLQTETKRSATYLTGSGNCESSLTGNVLSSRRTYDFTAETGNITYTEIGVGWAASGSTTVFSRILLAAPVALVAGQQLRVVYQLNLTITPNTPVSKNLPVSGWPVAPSTVTTGQECVQNILLSTVASNGTTSGYVGTGIYALEPSATQGTTTNASFALSTNATALAAFGSAANRATTQYLSGNIATHSVYASLNFYVDRNMLFGVAEAVSTSLRSLVIGHGSSAASATYQAFTFLFDQVQAKSNTQTLSFTVRFSWGRTLA